MKIEELVARYPRLYHMTADGNWPTIVALGLLSVCALLDLFEVPEPRRSEIEAARRPESVAIDHPTYGRVVIRDNKPLLESRLQSCLLDGMTPVEWYRLLNRRVFFWPTRERVETLLGAASYRLEPQVVMTLRSDRLLAVHGRQVTLSTINSGATRPYAWPRGPGTFQSLEVFDFDARRRYGQKAIAEVSVDYSVPKVLNITEKVLRHNPDGSTELLWTA